MTLGPLEYTVIGFRDNEHFTGAIADELQKVVHRGVIRIVDVVFVAKSEAGELAVIEADGLDQKAFAALKPALEDHMGLLTAEDVATLAELIEPGTSAMMIMFEHRWAEKLKDAITEEEIEPDEKLMRSIEEQIGISENAKNTFRQEILIRISTYARKGKPFEYRSHERLKEAIEKKIFSDLKDVVKITTSAKQPDADQLRRINEVIDRLVTQHGYCTVCANELLSYVGTLLSR